jgi:hypothetical protein
MIGSLPPDILDRWCHITALRDQAFADALLDPERLQTFQQELAAIRSSALAQEDRLLSEVLDRIEGCLPRNLALNAPLSEAERTKLLHAYDETRIRLLLGFIASQTGEPADRTRSELRDLLRDNPELPRRAVTHGLGGLIYGRIAHTWGILMPDIKSPDQCDLVLQELQRIYETGDSGPHWVIDFSGVKTMPLFMAGTLLGYRGAPCSVRISLCWVKADLLAETGMERLAKSFDCLRVGEYYFSR